MHCRSSIICAVCQDLNGPWFQATSVTWTVVVRMPGRRAAGGRHERLECERQQRQQLRARQQRRQQPGPRRARPHRRRRRRRPERVAPQQQRQRGGRRRGGRGGRDGGRRPSGRLSASPSTVVRAVAAAASVGSSAAAAQELSSCSSGGGSLGGESGGSWQPAVKPRGAPRGRAGAATGAANGRGGRAGGPPSADGGAARGSAGSVLVVPKPAPPAAPAARGGGAAAGAPPAANGRPTSRPQALLPLAVKAAQLNGNAAPFVSAATAPSLPDGDERLSSAAAFAGPGAVTSGSGGQASGTGSYYAVATGGRGDAGKALHGSLHILQVRRAACCHTEACVLFIGFMAVFPCCTHPLHAAPPLRVHMEAHYGGAPSALAPSLSGHRTAVAPSAVTWNPLRCRLLLAIAQLELSRARPAPPRLRQQREWTAAAAASRSCTLLGRRCCRAPRRQAAAAGPCPAPPPRALWDSLPDPPGRHIRSR